MSSSVRNGYLSNSGRQIPTLSLSKQRELIKVPTRFQYTIYTYSTWFIHYFCNKTAGELGHLWQWNILFLYHFLLLCNSLKCMGHHDSKGVHRIIQVDKY